MSDAAIAALRALGAALSTSVAADALMAHEPPRLLVRDVRAMAPPAAPVLGPVRTLRYLPWRADLPAIPGGNARTRVLDTLCQGEILMIQSVPGGSPAIGDVTALRAQIAGAGAIVTDGAVRDTPDLRRAGLPVFATRVMPALGSRVDLAWECDQPIACGSVLVMPGDWAIADADGVLVLPAGLLEILAENATRLLAEEAFSKALLARGRPIGASYPIPPDLRAAYARWRETGTLPEDIAS